MESPPFIFPIFSQKPSVFLNISPVVIFKYVSPSLPSESLGFVNPERKLDPGVPGSPCSPVSPFSPAGPWGPVAPVSPLSPAGPWGPVSPFAPSALTLESTPSINQWPFAPIVITGVWPSWPGWPWIPWAPVAPVSPFSPSAPFVTVNVDVVPSL